MTKEEFEYLSQFDDRFITATKANYALALKSADVIKIKDIYSRLIGQPYNMNTSCSTCVLKLLQKLSKFYFEYGREKNSRETQESETEHIGVGQGTKEEGNSKKAGKRKK
jgi:hypothetical protein